MALVDIIFRVDEICKKYEKYDANRQKDLNGSGKDPFSRLYESIESDIGATISKSEAAAKEKKRAKVVAMNAEIRKTKAQLVEEVTKLQKLAYKKVNGISKDDMMIRGDMALALADKIKDISDGTNAFRTDFNSSQNRNYVTFDIDGETQLKDGYFEQSEESDQFRQEYERRKLKQDEGLDVISEGLGKLKDLANDMNEEFDRQVPLLDEIDTKVDKATVELKNNYVRLKQTLNQVRSSRNFCIDIILFSIILGITAYLYNVLKDT